MFSEAGLAAIEEAISGGYLEVEYDDKRVKYRSLAELLQVRDLIRSKLGSGTVSFKRDTDS